MSRRFFVLLFILIFAWALRTVHPAKRPMHTDEAVHAVKFGALLEHHHYHYDPFEYHGPTLNYFTLIPAWLRGQQNLLQVDEATLRIVPAFFGVLLLLTFLLFGKQWDRTALYIALALTAVSPAMVFYSRYYIQEMLLVCFSSAALAGVWRFATTGRASWAILTGVAIGLMHATKETSLIALFALLASLLFTALLNQPLFAPLRSREGVKNSILLAGVALLVSMLFYSSFGSHPAGMLDALKSIQTYLNRAVGLHQAHLHPWTYYFQLLLFNHTSGRPLWSEAAVVLLSLYSFYLILFRRSMVPALLLYLGGYALLMAVLYSVLTYKTPWSMLGFYQPMILLAAFAAARIFKSLQGNKQRLAGYAVLALMAGHLLWQTWLQNSRYDCDPSNPYVYGHTSRDVFKIVERIRRLAQAHPLAESVYIEVVCTADDYWPLPWYLRDFSQVAYWNHVELSAPLAELVVASPDQEQAVLHKVYETPPPGERNLYVPMFDDYMELRPGVELRGYVTSTLWERCLRGR
ncbi:TIGR03663 family protein [bacterium]|nr:TIGR03663 family protein [bacterium]